MENRWIDNIMLVGRVDYPDWARNGAEVALKTSGSHKRAEDPIVVYQVFLKLAQPFACNPFERWAGNKHFTNTCSPACRYPSS